MSEKVTGGGGGDCLSHRTKLILWSLGGFIVLVGFTVFLVYIILQPSRPSFILQDVTVYTFNVSTTPPYALTTNMQATLYSKNPNSRIGIEYQPSMDLYASYRGQQVTYASSLPQSYQGHKEIVEWSPFLKGDDVPISPLSGQALAQDMNAGAVMMNIKLDGLVKWKVGGWSSGNYRLYVTCPVNIRFGDMLLNGGFAVSQAVFKGQPVDHCSVETRVGS